MLTLATLSDRNEILKLYRAVMQGTFCTWNENYPTELEIDGDISAKTLYVVKENGVIIGAVSIVPENELDNQSFWDITDAREIARVAVLSSHQGNSLALAMVLEVEQIIENQGGKAVHLLVAKQNVPAEKTYAKAGYIRKASVYMYGIDFFAMEKML